METVEQQSEKVKVYDSFLRNEIVLIKPIEGQWGNLVADPSKLGKEPFMYNKVKQGFTVPINKVQTLLNDVDRKLIKKYEKEFPNGMTEKEFLEKELNINLNPYLPSTDPDNYLRNPKRSSVIMGKEVRQFNLASPKDYLDYLIVSSNDSRISPNWEKRKSKPSYAFAIVKPDQVAIESANSVKIKAAAMAKFATDLMPSSTAMKQFLKSQGISIGFKSTDEFLINQINMIIEKDPSRFLNELQDADYKVKIFIQECVDAGALIRIDKDNYALETGGTIGTLEQVITYLRNPENSTVKATLVSRITNYVNSNQ